MNKDSIRKMMDLIDDPKLRQKMEDVGTNLERVDRMKEERMNPGQNKVRSRSLHKSMTPELEEKVQASKDQIALVLTGGGGKGSFQAGVLKALEETDLPALTGGKEIRGVAGTSAGALNAVLFAGGQGGQAAKLWSEVEEDKIEGEGGFFSGSPDNDRYLLSLIRKTGVLKNITMDSVLTLVTALNSESGYPEDFILNVLTEQTKEKCLMASAAVPLAIEEQRIKGRGYIDGGIPVFGSNMPVAPLYQLGFRSFIVIHCCSAAEAADSSGLTNLSARINRERYFNGAGFVHIFSQEDLGGLFEGTVNFDHEYIMKNIRQGYEDFMKAKEDLQALAKSLPRYDELHVVKGNTYRSYGEFLEG